jgi:hypothetical protein
MGIYTDSNGDARTINIGGNSLKLIQNNPDFHFCWMRENSQYKINKVIIMKI